MIVVGVGLLTTRAVADPVFTGAIHGGIHWADSEFSQQSNADVGIGRGFALDAEGGALFPSRNVAVVGFVRYARTHNARFDDIEPVPDTPTTDSTWYAGVRGHLWPARHFIIGAGFGVLTDELVLGTDRGQWARSMYEELHVGTDIAATRHVSIELLGELAYYNVHGDRMVAATVTLGARFR